MDVVDKAFSVSDSIFLVLLIGLAIGMWWLIQWILKTNKWILKTNNERESRYIQTIDRLAQVEGLKNDIAVLRKEVRDGHDEQKKMLGRVLDRLPVRGVD